MRPGASTTPVRFHLMPSSVIRRFSYDPQRRALTVLFITGRCYRYAGVPPHVHDAMRRTIAKGTFFNTRIRGRYACEELGAGAWDGGADWPSDDPAFVSAA